VATVAIDAGLTAPRLLGEVLEIQRAEQTFHADMDVARDPILRGADVDLRETNVVTPMPHTIRLSEGDSF
jgi:hypothetical protein